MKCLVVDDNELNLEMTLELIKAFDVDCQGVTDAREAIDILKNAGPYEYPLVLMDYRMPNMDGAEATKIIRSEILAHPPVIIGLSGDNDKETVDILLDAGMDDVLCKPVDISELMVYLKRMGFELGNDTVSDNDLSAGISESQSDDGSIELLNSLHNTVFDTQVGISNSKSPQRYIEFLRSFVTTSQSKLELIEKSLFNNDIKRFTIEVHALKSTMRSLGNDKLSNLCQCLEVAGDENDIIVINKLYPEFKECFNSSVELLKTAIFDKLSISVESYDVKEVLEILEAMEEMVNAFDIDGADRCMAHLNKKDFKGKLKSIVETMDVHLQDIDYTNVLIDIDRMKQEL